MYLFILGVVFGSGLVLAIQELHRQYDNHVIRKEAKFAAAVNAEIERRNGCGCHASWDHHEAFMLQGTTQVITRTPDKEW